MHKPSAIRVAAAYLKQAGPLTSPANLRHQAVFTMGAMASGKSYQINRWLKYMPGAGPEGLVGDQDYDDPRWKQLLSEQERSLSNLKFEAVRDSLLSQGIQLEITDTGSARIPFALSAYDHHNKRSLIPRSEWADRLPPAIYKQVEGLEHVVFSTPKYELPSYWRQIAPDEYKRELAGFMEKDPGYVHSMSMEMSQAYFEAALLSGDPVIVDGTGQTLSLISAKIQTAKDAGYRVSLIWIKVPLVVNLIRNAVRDRSTPSLLICEQYGKIAKNFMVLKNMVDKYKVIDNRNDPVDVAKYLKHSDMINKLVASDTGGRFPDLYSLVQHYAPQDLADWGKLIQLR